MIYISSDHRGFEMKNYITSKFLSEKVEIIDLGPKTLEIDDDYPDYAKLVAEKIKENPENLGILICANGVGINIAANKFRGVRAALSWDPEHAKTTRTDDGSNILTLPADYLTNEKALEIVETWLATNFSGEERHLRRLVKLSNIEFEQK